MKFREIEKERNKGRGGGRVGKIYCLTVIVTVGTVSQPVIQKRSCSAIAIDDLTEPFLCFKGSVVS